MQRPNYGLLSCVILLAVLVGVVGGGVAGGLTGYYTALKSAPTAVAVQPMPVVSASTSSPAAIPPVVTNLTLKEESAVIDSVRKVKPAVVTVVSTLQSRSRFSTISPTASGSGVIIDDKGYIITNNHVIEGGKSTQVIYADGTKADVTLVGTDAVADIAVLKVEGKVPAVAAIGDSNALEPGQVAIAIGSPLGDFRGTVTVGVISAVNRRVGQMQGLVQTDAAINNGNSGGPLINTSGQVIGINTLVVRSTNEGNVAEGLGFAVPSNQVRQIVDQLITKGKVERAYLGVSYQDVDPQISSALNLNTTYGVVVMEVVANSPAAKAGLLVNDVILDINGQKIDQDHSLSSLLFMFKAGDTVTVNILRDGKQQKIQATLTVRPS
jgi:2-alkenal reductase